MLGFRKKPKPLCFLCQVEPIGKFKLEVNTSEGLLVKTICDTCVDSLDRIQRGESIHNVVKEIETDD